MTNKVLVCDKCGAINRVDLSKADTLKSCCGKCGTDLHPDAGPVVVTADKLEKVVRHAELPVVVDVYADWCGPCKTYAPIFADVATRHWRKAEFLKIDSERAPEFSAKYNIRGIPATLIFRGGSLVNSQSGLLNASQLESLF